MHVSWPCAGSLHPMAIYGWTAVFNRKLRIPYLRDDLAGTHPLFYGLAGGLCLTLIGRICCGPLSHRSLALRCLTGSGIITGVELCTGLVVNNLLGFGVWDYKDMPLNILGQVCLPYSLLWCLLTLPAMALCDLLKGIKLD